MANAVRVFYSVNSATLGDRIEELKSTAAEIRKEEGCVEFDYFRSPEFPENFVQAEIWENAAAFDRHWQRHGAAGVFCDPVVLAAPSHRGTAMFPRRHGPSGAEFYRFAEYERHDRTYVSKDPANRTRHLRWPARSAVRILIEMAFREEDDETLLAYSKDTRTHPGCLQFDWFRSINFPENVLHLELWDSPAAVYDGHYFRRALQEIWHNVGVPLPPMTPVERRYGKGSFEFYEHGFSELVGDVWEPEDPELRLTSVRWA